MKDDPKLIIKTPYEPLLVFPHVIKTLQRDKKRFPRLYVIWSLIYLRGKEKATNQPWCNNKFLAMGSGFGINRVGELVKQLVKLELIEIHRGKTKTGAPGKRFIQIHNMPSVGRNHVGEERRNHVGEVTERGERNALRNTKVLKIKCLKDSSQYNHKLGYYENNHGIKRNPPIKKISPSDPNHPKNKKYLTLAKQLYRLLRNKKKLHPTAELKLFSKEIRLLIESDLKKRDYSKQEAIQEVKAVLEYYKNHIGDKYCPQAFSSTAFRAKFDKLQNAVERENATESKQNKSDGLIEDGILIG